MKLYPMKLRPVLKDIIWGGTRLANEYNKSEPNQKIAESWELCVHPNGSSIIENGEYANKTLEELFRLNPSIVSRHYKTEYKPFPILIKFIDAEQDLSVQVHPDNEYAAKNAGESGKTEMWFVIDCKPGAQLVYGLNGNYTREQLENFIQDGKFETCLNYIDVKPGDVFFIPAGIIHAIGAGILLAEIQQNSDTTYRLYDYNRPGADGKPRELHVKKALDVCVKTQSEYQNPKIKSSVIPFCEILSCCEYFTVFRYEFTNANMPENIPSDTFLSVICLDGAGEIIHNNISYSLTKGDSYFLPAGINRWSLSGTVDLIVSMPDKQLI